MDTVNVLSQMAKYDCSVPIHAEIIFEDSEDSFQDSFHQNALSDQENIEDNNNNEQVSVKKHGPKNKNDTICSENNHTLKNKNNTILRDYFCNGLPVTEISEKPSDDLKKSKNTEMREITNDIGRSLNQNPTDANRHASNYGNEVVNNHDNSPSTRQMTDHHEPVTTFIEDILNKLSEHIVLIMQSFYHYGVKRQNQDNKKREEIFHFIKLHFFELSYTTMESIILPQEQNNSFINTFLDNTVVMANVKSERWKCHKGHVIPFFKELIAWTKEKKQKIKENHTLPPSNENITLRQQLIRPVLSFDFPPSEIVGNSNVPTANTQNNLCIFTSGAPGQEISINIDTNTLIHYSEKQQHSTSERNGNHDNYDPGGETLRRNTSVARPMYVNGNHDMPKNNSHYNRPPQPYNMNHNRPPPPYNMNHSSKNLPRRPQQNNKKNMNSVQNLHKNMEQPRQNHQNLGQSIYSYQSQVQNFNTRQISPSYNDSTNYIPYDNTNNNILRHGTQTLHEASSGPIITSVTSLNSRTHTLNVRCFMCGKSTPTQCASFNTPCTTQHYCSYLCQELDSQIYKPAAWENS